MLKGSYPQTGNAHERGRERASRGARGNDRGIASRASVRGPGCVRTGALGDRPCYHWDWGGNGRVRGNSRRVNARDGYLANVHQRVDATMAARESQSRRLSQEAAPHRLRRGSCT